MTFGNLDNEFKKTSTIRGTATDFGDTSNYSYYLKEQNNFGSDVTVWEQFEQMTWHSVPVNLFQNTITSHVILGHMFTQARSKYVTDLRKCNTTLVI